MRTLSRCQTDGNIVNTRLSSRQHRVRTWPRSGSGGVAGVVWLDIIVKIASSVITLSAAAALCITPIRKRVVDKITRDDAARAGIRALLRKQIIDACDKAREQNGLIFYQRENITDMFDQYEALGGNHGIKDIVEEARSLPTIILKKEIKK